MDDSAMAMMQRMADAAAFGPHTLDDSILADLPVPAADPLGKRMMVYTAGQEDVPAWEQRFVEDNAVWDQEWPSHPLA